MVHQHKLFNFNIQKYWFLYPPFLIALFRQNSIIQKLRNYKAFGTDKTRTSLACSVFRNSHAFSSTAHSYYIFVIFHLDFQILKFSHVFFCILHWIDQKYKLYLTFILVCWASSAIKLPCTLTELSLIIQLAFSKKSGKKFAAFFNCRAVQTLHLRYDNLAYTIVSDKTTDKTLAKISPFICSPKSTSNPPGVTMLHSFPLQQYAHTE